MAYREITLTDICGKLNLDMSGNDILIDGLNLCNRVSKHRRILSYASSVDFTDTVLENTAVMALVVTKEHLPVYEKKLKDREISYIIAADPEKTFYDIHEYLCKKTDFYREFEFESVIGKGCSIHPTASIENGVVIGNHVIIGTNTVIKKGTQIEDNCEIGCNTTIGSEGFQVLRIENRNRKMMHVGGLLIKKDSFIGDNVCVCNSLFENTTQIGENVKIDNLCYIGHNVVIGDNAVIAACVSLCGSSVVDSGAWIGVNSSVLNRVEVGCHSKIGMGSVVTRNIPDGSLAYGVPAIVKHPVKV